MTAGCTPLEWQIGGGHGLWGLPSWDETHGASWAPMSQHCTLKVRVKNSMPEHAHALSGGCISASLQHLLVVSEHYLGDKAESWVRDIVDYFNCNKSTQAVASTVTDQQPYRGGQSHSKSFPFISQ